MAAEIGNKGNTEIASRLKLAKDHAAVVYSLCFAVTEDPVSAKAALIRVFEKTADPSKPIREQEVADRLFTDAVKIARKSRANDGAAPLQCSDTLKIDSEIWNILHHHSWRERLLCCAHIGLGWPIEKTARLLKIDTVSLQRELDLLKQEFHQVLSRKPELSKLGIDDVYIEGVIKRLYTRAPFSDQEVLELLHQAQQLPGVNKKQIRHTKFTWVAILIVIAGLLYAGFALTGGMKSKENLEETRITIQPNSEVKITPSVPYSTKRTRSLRWYSSSDEIKQKLLESSSLWQTLYLDVQIIDYGPESFYGAPRIYHSQLWIGQPEQSIVLFGLFHKPPASAYLWANGRNFYLNPVTGESYSHSLQVSPFALIQNAIIRQMVFPSVSPWVLEGSTMQVYDTDKIAGVNALVVEYFDRFGSREMRLWVEPVKGTILRVQEFGGPNQEILVKDSLVTRLEFDQNFPPAELINTIREVGNVQLTTQPGQAEPGQPAPVPVSPLATRIPPIIEPAPSWLDLGKTHLSFQFTNNLEISSQISGTASSPAQLFADGYFLANIQFGLPWMLRCDRSIDGLRIAFNTGSDGTSIPDDGLRWIDLRNPTVVYEPAPSMHVEEFAFSTDGSQIAFIGKEKTSNLKAIYILDLSTGEAKKIISIRDGRSLTWSPDQESLAWIGQLENSQDVEALLVHVRTGLISFRDTFPQNGDTSQLDWPMANWGKIFPTSMGGLEKCASLPDQ